MSSRFWNGFLGLWGAGAIAYAAVIWQRNFADPRATNPDWMDGVTFACVAIALMAFAPGLLLYCLGMAFVRRRTPAGAGE